MIPMPRKVMIAGHPWKILRKPARAMYFEGAKCRGLCIPDRYEIWLYRGLVLTAAQEYLVHELLHACVSSFVGNRNRMTEEVFVDGAAKPIVAMLRDNPRLVAYLTQK